MCVSVAERLRPLLAQYDHAGDRLVRRMAGPAFDSGNGVLLRVDAMPDEELLWEPVRGCWSVRPRSQGPGPDALSLAGAGPWGRDSAPEAPWPPPVTTIAWRLSHLTEMLAMRADWTTGAHALRRDQHLSCGRAAEAVADFGRAVAAWREAVVSAGDAELDQVGRSTYPHGSDAEEPFLDVVRWVNQEVLHHGAEIALVRDLYRAFSG